MKSKTIILNSLGLDTLHEFTGSHVILTAIAKENGKEGSGYQRQSSRCFYELDFEKIAEEAADSALSTIGYRNHIVPNGERTVIFEAEAAAEFLGTLTQMAFSINRTPRTTNKVPLGDLILDEKLTVYDNGRDKRTLQASAIDGEGTPKKALCLINNGVPENRCYSRDSAKAEGKETTGHAAAPWSGYFWTGTGNGSTYTPTNQIIEPGTKSLEELISDTRNGILVRRLRCPAANGQTIMPDIIRADTQECWSIRNGQVIGPANYIRFTDSLVNTLKDIEIGNYTTVKSIGSFVIPAIKINSLYISQPSVVMNQ
jgi:PmbA protein